MKKKGRILYLIDYHMCLIALGMRWNIFVRFGKMVKYFLKSNNVKLNFILILLRLKYEETRKTRFDVQFTIRERIKR